jgi:predicted RNA-binding Zn ribbon-like protein
VRSANLDGWPWLGAPLGVDLANSLVQLRPGRTRDLLRTEDDIDGWLEHERARIPTPKPSPERLPAFRALRDALHAALSAAARGERPPAAAVKAINAASGRSDGHVRLANQDTAEYRGTGTPLDQALSAIARSAIELLTSPDRQRLRICTAPSCGMFYLGRPEQEWCSTACGNRARAARHYARRRRTRARI